MKYLTIEVSKSMNAITGEEWRRADVKVSIDEGENEDDVYAMLVEKVDWWLPNNVSDSYNNPYVSPAYKELTNGQSVLSTTEQLIKEINFCKSIDTLNQYKTFVSNKPELKEVYDKKYSELSK